MKAVEPEAPTPSSGQEVKLGHDALYSMLVVGWGRFGHTTNGNQFVKPVFQFRESLECRSHTHTKKQQQRCFGV